MGVNIYPYSQNEFWNNEFKGGTQPLIILAITGDKTESAFWGTNSKGHPERTCPIFEVIVAKKMANDKRNTLSAKNIYFWVVQNWRMNNRDTTSTEKDEDFKYWEWGIFYNNPNDKNFFHAKKIRIWVWLSTMHIDLQNYSFLFFRLFFSCIFVDPVLLQIVKFTLSSRLITPKNHPNKLAYATKYIFITPLQHDHYQDLDLLFYNNFVALAIKWSQSLFLLNVH